jgi:hypothetical protein
VVFFEGTRERCGVVKLIIMYLINIQVSMPAQQHSWVFRYPCPPSNIHGLSYGENPCRSALFALGPPPCTRLHGKTAIFSHVFSEFKITKINLYFYNHAAFIV